VQDPSRLFRALIVASTAIGLAGGLIDFLVPGLLPEVLAEAQGQWAGAYDPSASWGISAYFLGLLAGGIAATVGLFLFRRWARSLALWLTLLSLPAYVFFGAEARSGWAAMLMDSSWMMWGAVLGMAYFSEVRRRFDPAA
jgi:hypothetical protein